DAPRFAFSVPSINREAPMQRYDWRVLPQAMKNFHPICQWYVAKILAPIRARQRRAIILHYMDDVLVCCPDDKTLDRTLAQVVEALQAQGFELQPEKVQRTSPWKYLGLKIMDTLITPQPVTIKNDPKTLQELHQLCGSSNWVRAWLGLTTQDLAPLFKLLGGGGKLSSPRSLTPEARQALRKVEDAIMRNQAQRCLSNHPFHLIILGKDSLVVIEWVFLPHQPSKSITTPQELMARLIMRGRARLRTLAGCDFACIYLPL
ncbi:POK10 protein, partial [Dyaphorophyia castanea]|nr:POK10 protein [Platysteira castanea]